MVGGGMRGRGWGKCAEKMNGNRGLMRAILSLQGGQRTSEQVSRAYITKKGVKMVQRPENKTLQFRSGTLFLLFTHRKAVMIVKSFLGGFLGCTCHLSWPPL